MQSQTSDTFPFHNGNDPISYYDPAFSYNKPFSIDSESNSTPKPENNRELIIPSPPPLSFFHFPYSPPFEDPQIFLEQHHDFLLQLHHQSQNPEPQNTMEGSAKKSGEVPRKRSSKRDRHSKINTARGLRDRRMRLSLEVAKRFFGLQDILGFDKASKTVEWLLNQAKGEINSLTKEKKKQKKKSDDHQSCNSGRSSECEEGVSSLDEIVVSGDQEQQQEERVVKGVKRTRVKNYRKIMSAFHPLAKECRERARERARERTKEKMRRRGILNDESKKSGEEANQDLSQLGSWNPFETGEECGAKNHSVNPSLDLITEANKEQRCHIKEHLGTLEATAHDDDSLVILNNR